MKKTTTKKILQAQTWQERLALVEDKLPGTSHDKTFADLEETLRFAEMDTPGSPIREVAADMWKWYGKQLAEIVKRGDSKALRDMAKALKVWTAHKRKVQPDDVLAVLIELTGLFPPGWGTRWVTAADPKTRKVKRGLPPGSWTDVAMRDLRVELKKRNPRMTDQQWETHRKHAQHWAPLLHIKLDSRPGKPPGKKGAAELRHNQHKTA